MPSDDSSGVTVQVSFADSRFIDYAKARVVLTLWALIGPTTGI